jgi:hypothetical protein
MPVKDELNFAVFAAGLVALLLLAASAAGLLYGDVLYDPDPLILPQLYGQDAISIIVGLPLLVGSTLMARRGSVRGLLLLMGAFFYVVYSYFFYVVGVRFNVLFLVYVAMVAASLYGLMGLLLSVDPSAIKARFDGRTPVRLIGGFLLAIASFFALMWIGTVVSSLAAGTPLDPVTRQVIVIDCTVLLPLMFIAGVSLWRDGVWGYTLGGLLLVKLATLGLTLVVNTILLMRLGQPVDASQAVAFAVVMVGALALLIPYLRGVQEA